MCARRCFSSDLITGSRKQIAVLECAIEPYKAHLFGRPSGKTSVAGTRQNDGVPIKDKGGWGGPPHQTVVWDTGLGLQSPHRLGFDVAAVSEGLTYFHRY